MQARTDFAADLTFFAELEAIALQQGDRSSRASRAAGYLRQAWPLRHVGIFDVVPGGFVLLGSSGDTDTEAHDADLVVPVNSLSGDLIGTLEVYAEPAAAIHEEDRLRLEACAGMLWWLWAT